MISRVKTIVESNRVLLENFSFLSILQVSNLIIFFLMIPFLFRVLGKEYYGLVVFAQTIALYFSILVNYGFNVTATRDVSIYRSDSIKLSEIISSVLTLKLFFFSVSFLILLVLVFFIPFFRDHRMVFIFSMLYCLNEALFPLWYFQGIEKMKYITYLNVGTRIISAVMIFILISEPSDYSKVPLILGSGILSGALLGLFLVFRVKGNVFVFQSYGNLFTSIVVNFPMFISNVSSQIYVNANRLVVGTWLGMADLAIYDIAERIVNIAKVPLVVIGQVLFPKVSRDGNVSFILKIMKLTTLAYSLVYVALFLFSGTIVEVITDSPSSMAVTIIRILGFSIIPVSAGLFLSELILVPFGFIREYARMRSFSLLLFLVILILLTALKSIGVIQLSIAVVVVEIFVLLYSGHLSRKLLFKASREL